MDEPHIYLMPYNYNNLNNIVGWNVMISPEGEVYKIYERDRMATGHDFFAEQLVSTKYGKNIYDAWKKFQERNPEYKTVNLGAKDILINFYGFVNYEFDSKLELRGPEYKYSRLRVTDKQLLIVQKLIVLNKDKFNISQILDTEEKYGKYM